MADNRIELVAQLNVDASEQTIQSQLDGIGKNLSLKVNCNIDTSSVESLKKQLSSLKVAPIKIQTSSGGLVPEMQMAKDQAKELAKALDLKFPRGRTTELRAELQALIDDYRKFYELNDAVGKENSFNAILDFAQKYERELKIVNEELVAEQRLIKSIAQTKGQVVNVSSIYGDLVSLGGSQAYADKSLTTLFGGKNRWTAQIGYGNTEFDKIIGEINNRMNPELYKGLDFGRFESDAQSVHRLLNVLSADAADMSNAWYKAFGEDYYNSKIETTRDTLNSLLGIKNQVSSGGAVEIFDMNNLDLEEQKVKNISDTAKSTQLVDIFDMNELDVEEQKVKTISETAKDGSNRPVFDLTNLNEAGKAVEKVNAEAQKTQNNIVYPQIGFNSGGTSSDILKGAKEQINSFLQSQDRMEDKADRVKRAIEDTSGSLQRFYVQVERGDKSVETLTYALNEQGTAYEYLGKVVREADNSTDFRSKDINTQWDIQTEKVRGFAAQLQRAGLTSEEFKKGLESLQAKLSARGDNNAMHSFLDDFDLLKAKAAATTQEIQATNKAMREADAVTTLGNRIKSTASALEAWGNANRKAVTSTKQMSGETTTYAEKFAELTRRINEYKVKMQNGTLTPADISNFRHLTEEVNAYKKSADAAGLTTSRFFTNMNSQLHMVLQRWISLYAVIGYIRKMVEEVKSLDTAMINLKRVTDETEESYQKFLERANSNASALKTTTSSIVEQSYQWAKLGYSMDEALELANASTIYQRVGDVDQSQALSNLVTSLKAFKLEAKDTMGVVDRLDKLNNEFAVSASGLGQGLERSASAMAMTGNSLDQTLALLTGAGEITQNLENTGRKVAHKKLYRLKS